MKINLQEKINQDVPTLVEFINSNCEPCAMIEPTLQKVNKTIGKRINIFVVNVQDVPEIVDKFSIDSVPMLALFHGGDILWKTSTILSKQEIIDKVLDSI
ncbi:thioredoxin family protein [Flavobacterium sp.]|uniref:thioredoxin family protein n=1 Tax=Flavobacterium sp. TaxID=239 RepID=UPI003527C61F